MLRDTCHERHIRDTCHERRTVLVWPLCMPRFACLVLHALSASARSVLTPSCSQVGLIKAGKAQEIVQETRLWDEFKLVTYTMRKKEGLADYRCGVLPVCACMAALACSGTRQPPCCYHIIFAWARGCKQGARQRRQAHMFVLPACSVSLAFQPAGS